MKTNNEQKASDMDIHFKDGVITCKFCKKQKKYKWPMLVSELMSQEFQQWFDEFVLDHTPCKIIQN